MRQFRDLRPKSLQKIITLFCNDLVTILCLKLELFCRGLASLVQKKLPKMLNFCSFHLLAIICLIFSAPQVGLEPTTYGLTVRRSNQLSY